MGIFSVVARELPSVASVRWRDRVPSVRTGANPTKAERFALARAVVGPLAWSTNAKQAMVGIGEGESLLGLAGSFAPGGVPSYNWGAITGNGPAGYIVTTDHDKNGVEYSTHFQKFPDMLSGLKKFLEVVIHPGTGQETAAVDEFNRGDAHAIAARMYANGYFTGTTGTDAERIDAYAKLIVNNAAEYARAIGEPLLVSGSGGASTYVPAGGTNQGQQPGGAASDDGSGAILALGAVAAVVGGILAFG